MPITFLWLTMISKWRLYPWSCLSVFFFMSRHTYQNGWRIWLMFRKWRLHRKLVPVDQEASILDGVSIIKPLHMPQVSRRWENLGLSSYRTGALVLLLSLSVSLSLSISLSISLSLPPSRLPFIITIYIYTLYYYYSEYVSYIL